MLRLRFHRRTTSAGDREEQDTPAARHAFSADRPISSSAEDRLDRTTFATRVADSIRSWRGRDSLVVGLYGRWGSGKTSIINLALERLTEVEPTPKVIKFNPWEWAGHEELATALFAEIAKALDRERSSKASSLARRFRSYAAALNAGGSLAAGLAPIVAGGSTVLIAAGVGLLQVGEAGTAWTGGIITVLGAVGVILSQARDLMESFAAALEQRSADRRSLHEVKHALAQAIAEYDRTLLVVVDDVDRLAPADAVRMLQLVKANADLPGIVFLLALDREGLTRSIRAALRVDGNDYLEKIVQVGFNIPMPDRVAFEQLLIDGVHKAIAPEPVQRRFDEERWRALYAEGILPFITTLRNVVRFCSMLEFGLQAHIDRGECNVDPVDFIGIEVLRQFEPNLYQAIAASKDVLTGLSQGDQYEYKRTSSLVQELLRAASKGPRHNAARHVLTELFPAAEWAISGVGQAIDPDRQIAERRVSNPESFDYYFQLEVPSYEISEGEVKAVLRAASDGREALAEALRGLCARAVMRAFLLRLKADLTVIPLNQEAIFIAALFDIGDEFEGVLERRNLLAASESQLAVSIVDGLLSRVDSSERESFLRVAISKTSGLLLPVELLHLDEFRRKNNRQFGLDQDADGNLASSVVDRIKKKAADGTLQEHRHLAILLYAWSWWGVKSECQKWAEAIASNPGGLMRLAQAFTGYGTSNNQHPLAEFINIEAAVSRSVEWLEGDKLSENEAVGVKMFLQQIERCADRLGLSR